MNIVAELMSSLQDFARLDREKTESCQSRFLATVFSSSTKFSQVFTTFGREVKTFVKGIKQILVRGPKFQSLGSNFVDQKSSGVI